MIREAILKFPPDLSFGYKPKEKINYRMSIGLISALKNIIPLYVLDRFSKLVWSNNYDRLLDTIPDLLKLMPYIPLLLMVFPLTAAHNKFERGWEEHCSEDYLNSKLLYHKSLPFEHEAYDAHNNKQDILNKLLFYPSYMVVVLSFTIIYPSNVFPLFGGIVGFVIHGFHSGYWSDLNARIRAQTIILTNRMN